ncbi:MAG: hypothetical protein J6M16_06350 [Clostridia bacterium]|nr:hypothetical protein [Clostridia bacterium]
MKRKIKLLILTLSVVAMLFAFAISSSASNYVNFDDFVILPNAHIDTYSVLNTNKLFDSSSPEEFGYDTISCSSGSNIYYAYAFYNIEYWDTLFTAYNVQSAEDLLAFKSKLVELNFISGEDLDWDNFFNNADVYYNLYLSYKSSGEEKFTQADIDSAVTEATKDMYTQTQFDEAKATGVSEYKASSEYATALEQASANGVTVYKDSEEYKTALSTKYTTGYDEGKIAGVENYKSSEEYSTILNTKYNDGFVAGTAEGALAYTKSDAYKTAMADKYDEGYDDGFVEGEAQFDIAPFIGAISIMALISIGIVIVCWVRKKRVG